MSTTLDLLVYETGNGGDLSISGGGLSMTESLYTSIYLGLFGGNVEQSTTGEEEEGEERYDYWANSLFYPEDEKNQFNSETERVLNEVVLNTSGREKIKTAVNNDLSFLNDFVEYVVEVFILSSNKVGIKISFSKLQGSSNSVLELVWDNSLNQLIENKII